MGLWKFLSPTSYCISLLGWLPMILSVSYTDLLVVGPPLCKELPVFSNFFNEVYTIAVYVYNFILSNFIVSCEGIVDLPTVAQFSNLDRTDN